MTQQGQNTRQIIQKGQYKHITDNMTISRLDLQEVWINKVRQQKLHLNLSKMIINRPELISASIEGEKRMGKTVYGLLVMYDIYQNWDTVFKYVAFTKEDIQSMLNNITKLGIRVPVIMWDDAGVHASAASYMLDPKQSIHLKGLFDTIGTVTKAILIPTPDGSDLLKPIRKSQSVKIRIKAGRHKWDRKAFGYKMGRSPLGTKFASRLFEDNFNVKIPIYEHYFKMREKYSMAVLKDMDEHMNADNDKPKVDVSHLFVHGDHSDMTKGGFKDTKELEKHRRREYYARKKLGIANRPFKNPTRKELEESAYLQNPSLRIVKERKDIMDELTEEI